MSDLHSSDHTTLISRFVGQTVNNADDEFVGHIDDFLVSDTGHIASVIINTGGVLGVGRKTVAVPFTDCTILETLEGPRLVLSALRKGEVLVAAEYVPPGAITMGMIKEHAVSVGQAAAARAGEIGGIAAGKVAEVGQKAAESVIDLGAKASNKVAELVHKGITNDTAADDPKSPKKGDTT